MISKLSVITPVYNGANFVDRCYYSLINQSFSDWEWIVVDDGSTDKTKERVHELACNDERIRLISYMPNKGRGYARMRAIEQATGEWIVILDVDDVCFPDRLLSINNVRVAGYDFFCSYAVLVDNFLNIKGVRGFFPARFFSPAGFVHPTLACKKELAIKIGYDPALHTGEDFTIIATLSAKYNGFFCDDTLLIYQEDREVNLEKAIKSNESQFYQFKILCKSGEAIKIGRVKSVVALIYWVIKIKILKLMRINPNIYLRTVSRRSTGKISDEWNLSKEKEDYIKIIREQFKVHSPSS